MARRTDCRLNGSDLTTPCIRVYWLVVTDDSTAVSRSWTETTRWTRTQYPMRRCRVGRGQPMADELRQQYEAAALRRRKQLSMQHSPATAMPDDDEQSLATMSTSTSMTLGGQFCWNCCGRHVSDDRVTPVDARAAGIGVLSSGGALGVGPWSSTGDCESVASCSDLVSRGSPPITQRAGGGVRAPSAMPISAVSVNRERAGSPNPAPPGVVVVTDTALPDGGQQPLRVMAKVKDDSQFDVTTSAAVATRSGTAHQKFGLHGWIITW